MASSANDSAAGEVSAAQRLLQQHSHDPHHHATVEDAPDEDLPAKSSEPASWNQSISTKAAGKRKEDVTGKNLDTQSHDLFPELSGPKSSAANVAPIWGAKSHANGKSNGASPANGASRSSTPGSDANTPKMLIPGRNVESITLEPQYIQPRTQLRRPIPDIIKDINRKSRANITMSTASNGRLKFDATGPQDVAQQAIKDLVSQIGTKVASHPVIALARGYLTNIIADDHSSYHSSVDPRSRHRQRWLNYQSDPGEVRCPHSASQSRHLCLSR